ncbi:unnamed protein product, partial [Heterosigma akashiwo]
MHINLDLLECCHLTAAMLLEVPNMALHPDRQDRRHIISRHFRKHRDIYGRQVFTGPPENTRDHVMAAAEAMAQGDWRRAAALMEGLDVWNLLPGEGTTDRVKAMLGGRSSAAPAYLFLYGPHYAALSLPLLCEMFGLDRGEAHSVVSKMILTEELAASWDQPTATVVLHRAEPSALQALAAKLADKCGALVESNERLLEA